jgi:hypothetical protein
VACHHVIAGKDHLDAIVVTQISVEEVLLSPELQPVHDEVTGIVIGQVDVMKMDEDARTKSRQDVEDQVADVTAGGDDVRTVDEEDVVL